MHFDFSEYCERALFENGLSLLFLRAASCFRFLVRFLRVLERLGRVFHSLPRVFVCAQMILFAVLYSGGPVRMCRQFVKLSSSLMGILHGITSLNSALGLTRGNARLVALRFHRFPRQRQPRKLFDEYFYSTPCVRRHFAAHLAAAHPVKNIDR